MVIKSEEKNLYERDEMLKMKRPQSTKIPMDRKKRAKQFAPFQALKGFEHSVKEKETVYEARKFQYDGTRSGLDQKLSEIGNREIRITYYLESDAKPGFGTYLEVYGVAKILPHLRIMEIGGLEIAMDDITDIKVLEDL